MGVVVRAVHTGLMRRTHGRQCIVGIALVLCLLCGATTAQAQAGGSGDSWWGADKALHFSFSAAISVGGYALAVPIWDEPLPRAVFAASLGLGAGVAKELYDLAGYGDPSYRDLAWDVIGVAFGTALALLIDLWLRDDASTVAKSRDGTLRVAAWR